MIHKLADLAILGGKLVLPDGVRHGAVTIRDGLIDRIVCHPDQPPMARTIRDVGGAYVLPGLMDSHVHFRSPGFTHKETWSSGSRAAAAGGVTTVIDMPNVIPHFADIRDLPGRIENVAGHSLVDFTFHLGVTPESIDALGGVDPSLVPSVKVFLAGHHTARHIIHEDSDLDRLFRVAARTGLILTLHAEDQATLDRLTSARGEPRTLGEHEQIYARAAALVSILRLMRLVERYGTRVHILHVSSAEEVELLVSAATLGLPMTFEVTSHHLTFTTADERLGTLGKLRPALRTRRDRERLWQAVLEGTVATIGSDHAPHTRAEKSVPFADAPPGFPGVQELAPAFLAGLREVAPQLGPDRHVQLLAQLASEMPAKLFGLSDRKGTLIAGRPADIVVLSPNRPWHVIPQTIHAHCGWSSYEGRTLFGAPTLTIRNGHIVYERGHFGEPDGRWLHCHHGTVLDSKITISPAKEHS